MRIGLNPGRIISVARNAGAMFGGAKAATKLHSVDTLLDFMDVNRSCVSLVAYRPDDHESAILLNPDTRRPLASTIKILVLAGYAQAVDQGQWSPEERVPLAAVEVYFLPPTDGGAHDRAVAVYRERGWLDASGRVRLRHVVWAMMAVSDNAATDYLLDRLGRSRAGSLPARLNVVNSDAPLPIGGVFLNWVSAVEEPMERSAWELADRLRDDPEFRKVWQDKPMVSQITFRQQARLSGTRSPKGTARDYANVMERVQRGDVISTAVSATMREFLEWPMENDLIRREFTAFGTKGGSLSGVLTEVTYAVPRDAVAGGVAALFLDRLPPAVWFILAESYLHQDFLRRLLSDPRFFEGVRRRLT